jgi:dTDP-4-dehydrorhamnose reductase
MELITTMTKILITGSKGQVGSELQALSINYNYDFFFTDRTTLDITNKEEIENFIQENSIDVIINAAAYTAVDKAEDDKESADRVNHLATNYLAEVAKEKCIKLIHISTDYVFDGQNFKPYTEDDTTNPNGVYGQTKLDGEKAMQAINPKDSIILRTSWVYSSFGANFVKTMLRLGKERESLGVIFDQVGTPTYARDLAKTILDIAPTIKNDKVEIYNYSNEGVLSWYDFAKEIMRMAKLECQITPIETSEYLALNADATVPKGKVGRPTPAKRPHYSLLNKSKIKKEFQLKIPYWKDSLDGCLKMLGERR